MVKLVIMNLDELWKKKFYEKADYILNHYDRNSHKDKLTLAKELERIYDDGYDDGKTHGFDSDGW